MKAYFLNAFLMLNVQCILHPTFSCVKNLPKKITNRNFIQVTEPPVLYADNPFGYLYRYDKNTSGASHM